MYLSPFVTRRERRRDSYAASLRAPAIKAVTPTPEQLEARARRFAALEAEAETERATPRPTPSRIAWDGGVVSSNKADALSKFLQRKKSLVGDNAVQKKLLGMLQLKTSTKAAIVKKEAGVAAKLVFKPALALETSVGHADAPSDSDRPQRSLSRFRRQLRLGRGTSSLTLWLFRRAARCEQVSLKRQKESGFMHAARSGL